MNKIKVMNIYNSLYNRGTEKYIKFLCEILDKNKYEISIVCLLEKGPDTEWFENRGIKVFEFYASNNQSPYYWFKNLNVIIKLAIFLKREKVHIVHSHDFFPALLARLASIIAQIPIVFITYHNNFEWLNKFHHIINKLLSYKTSKIICVSDSVLNYSLITDKINKEKYIRIYNCIDFSSFVVKPELKTHYLRQFNIDNNSIVLGTVGSITFRKGYKYLIEAFAKLFLENNSIYLVVIGSYNNNELILKEEIDTIIKLNKLENRVIMPGSRDDVASLLNLFDYFIMPSIVEGFGYSLIEAMAMQVPVICSDISPFKELTSNGKYGLLFKNKDSVDLYKRIKYALSNKTEMKMMGKNAANYVLHAFNDQLIAENYRKLYEEACSALPAYTVR